MEPMEKDTWEKVIRIYSEYLPFRPFPMAKMLALVFLLKDTYVDCHVYTSHLTLNIYKEQRNRWIRIDSQYDDKSIDDLYRGMVKADKIITLQPFYLSQAFSVIQQSLEILDNVDATN